MAIYTTCECGHELKEHRFNRYLGRHEECKYCDCLEYELKRGDDDD